MYARIALQFHRVTQEDLHGRNYIESLIRIQAGQVQLVEGQGEEDTERGDQGYRVKDYCAAGRGMNLRQRVCFRWHCLRFYMPGAQTTQWPVWESYRGGRPGGES